MNFEDVVLCRVLRHIDKGCYVDVGSSDPLICSNTAAFYQMGWRGICIEPIPDYRESWSKERPEDILINAVVGAQSGESEFYLYRSAPQLSTCSEQTVQRWKNNHCAPDQKYILPMVTLNEILEKNLNGRTIHLLSIDVEGFEKQVLQGFDIKKYKPWVIVIEATVPGMDVLTYEQWENSIIEAQYSMVYSDGVNRFYLSHHKSELLDLFRPPTSRDEFITFKYKILMDDYEALKKDYDDLEGRCKKNFFVKCKNLISKKIKK